MAYVKNPKTIVCRCDAEVVLDDSWYNVCMRCGQGYNMSGQSLAPPSQWGEETGERFDDNGSYIGGGEELDW